MKNDIVGIIDIDHPELTSDERRSLQLGELTEFPDGTSVADYIAEVELLKEIALEEAAEQREKDLAVPAEKAPKQKKNKKEEKEDERDEVTDEDVVFVPEVGEDPLI